MVHQVASKEEFHQYISSPTLVVVDFYAVWCGPCKIISPYLEELSKQFANVKFIKVDVDDLEDVASEVGIRAMPTFKAFKNGKEVGELVGADKNKLLALVQNHI